MVQFTEVIGAGPGWTTVRTSDGRTVTMQGARNWRNNNPGNLEYGSTARNYGAIGTDGRFAVFDEYNTGRTAKEGLLFNNSRYNNLSIRDAISKYAPPFENNTTAYVNAITSALGVPDTTTLSELTDAQRGTMLDTMQRVEGFRSGKATGILGDPLDPNTLQIDPQYGFIPDSPPTPTPRGQSPGDYGILGVIDPPTVTPVERGLLPDVQSTPQFDQSRFADGVPMGVDQLSGALSQQAANLSAPQSVPTGVLADQYNQYGAGQKVMREATLLGLDAAGYDPLARVKESLLAQAADPLHAPVSIDATTIQTAPQATLQMGTPTPQAPGAPASPPYVDPVITTATQPSMPQMPAIAQPQPSIPQLNRQAAPSNTQAALTGKALADKVGRDLQMRGILGGIGGGLLGGAFLGPVGGLLGGLLGRNAAQKTYYPPAPQAAAPQDTGGGRDSLSDIGKDAYDKSGQFQNAVDSGKQGLW